MKDDWSSPTGEFELPCRDPAHATGPHPRHADDKIDDEIDPVFGVTAAELRLVDAFFYQLALEAAEDPRPPTAAELVAIDDLRARFEHLKTMSPEEVAAERERLRRLG